MARLECFVFSLQGFLLERFFLTVAFMGRAGQIRFR